MITQERLKELLEYNPETGLFTRKVAVSNTKVGDIAGSMNGEGYIFISIDGTRYKAHRLVFLYMEGSIPTNQVDHINHIRDDNRWCNLRAISNQENHRNRGKNKNNSSGVTGVYWNNKNKRWCSQIAIDCKQIHLGTFTEFHEAVNARKNAEVLYGFHKNHGK